MNTLKLKISGCPKGQATVLVDNQKFKAKRNNYGNIEGTFQTEKSSVEISIYKYLEINGKLWVLMSLIFFVISLFGILEPRYDKHCIVYAYKIKVDLNETSEVKLALNGYSNNGRAFEISTECQNQELTNIYYVDNKAKKRLKIMKVVKIFMWIGLIVGIIVAIAKMIG